MTPLRELAEVERLSLECLPADEFFRTVHLLVPDATHMFLEGSPSEEVVAIVTPHVEPGEYRAPIGTEWSWPGRLQRFNVRLCAGLLDALADAADHHAAPEICYHLHFYREGEPLVHWYDAFDDPIRISKTIPREAIDLFCSVSGSAVIERE